MEKSIKNETDGFLRLKDTECEAVVLGAMINYSYAHNDVREIVSEECFTDADYKSIYIALNELDKRGESIDLIHLSQELRKHGDDELCRMILTLTANTYTSDIMNEAMYLRELATRRELYINLQNQLLRCCDTSDDIGEIITGVADTANNLLKGFSSQSCVTLKDADLSLLRHIEQNMNEGGVMTGTPTGFKKLDERGGLQPSDLIIIAAETSQGKTSLALAMAKNAIEQGERVGFYSMEMTKNQISARIVSMDSGISSSNLLYDKLSNEQLDIAMQNTCQEYKSNLLLDDNSTASIDKIIASIRAMHIKHGIKGAVIDYIQLLSVNTKNTTKEQAMGDIARRLKNLAKELDIWIIALSQLNRDKDKPIPSLNRLRDSGQIAEAADVVILVFRPEAYHNQALTYPDPFKDAETKGTAMIDVAKGRNMGIFKFLVNFDAPTTRFSDIVGEYPTKLNSVFETDNDPF